MYSHAETDDWKKAIENAPHYLAVGIQEVWIEKSKSDMDRFPWAHATLVEEGATYRNNVPISLKFEYKTKAGITLHWSIDLEPDNQTGNLTLNVDLIRRVKAALPESRRKEFDRVMSLHGCKVWDDVNRAERYLTECRARKTELDAVLDA